MRRAGFEKADPEVQDRVGIETLFDRHADQVWNQAYRLTGTWRQAEDLLIATFARAWSKSDEVRLVRDSALPWLYATAGNIARSRYRQADRSVPGQDDDRHTRQVIEAIRALPKSEREIAELCLLGDLAVDDTAALLGLTETDTRSRLSRADSRLRAALKGDR